MSDTKPKNSDAQSEKRVSSENLVQIFQLMKREIAGAGTGQSGIAGVPVFVKDDDCTAEEILAVINATNN